MSAVSRRLFRLAAGVLALGLVAATVLAGGAAQAAAPILVPISGAGSTWSQNAVDAWRRNVTQYNMTINYAGTGSTDGRNQFKNGTVDFAVSEIPYGIDDPATPNADDAPPNRKFAYMPIVAGGTSFMYNLKIGGRQVTNLRLSGPVITKIFTGVITNWSHPEIKADNPGLALPSRKIVPVVRSDGSGTTAQFTLWMSKEHGGLWNDYCRAAGRATPCGITSYYPTIPGRGFVAQAQSVGVAGYVAQGYGEGAITYVEYSYALENRFPVAKVLNRAGYYIEPKAANVAVGLLGATINGDLTQNLDNVYRGADARTYPLSSYSYMVLPVSESVLGFTKNKGYTLGRFAYYFLCQGQQQAEVLGYSPLPINLVTAAFDQVARIDGVEKQDIKIENCNNPTFSRDGTNTLARNAAQPPSCDAKSSGTQCVTGTGGATQETRNSNPVGGNSNNPAGGGNNPAAGGNNATGGATPTGVASAGPVAVDPDTGESLGNPGGGGNDEFVVATPVSLDGQGGWALRHTMMLLAGVLLAGLLLAPPLFTRRLAGRNGTDQRSPR
ncbi:phosphate ABC transporter substrate-binding protein PstS [Micromonospora pisi]|nr:phosphate ABC transporter substrate-binding protein PstS [Micromonospora pisi]